MNRLICCFLAVWGGLFWVCQRSDVVTGAGGGVVADLDTTLTDTRRGFAFIDVTADVADSSFSLPAVADPFFSTHVGGNVFVGVDRYSGDTLAGQVQFRAASFAAEPDATPRYTRDYTLEGVYLHFRAADANAATGGALPVYACDTLIGGHPVDRDDIGSYIDEESGEVRDAKIGKVKLSDGGGSVRIPDDIAQKIFEARVSGDSTAHHVFAFSIVGYLGDVQILRPPFVVVSAVRNNNTVTDTITGASRFTAFENTGDDRAAIAYSSHQSKRTAVFRVNVGKILDSLKFLDLMGDKSEIINAVIAVKHCAADSSCAGGFTSQNVGNYRGFILDTLLTNELPADTTWAARLLSLSGRFADAQNTATTNPHNVHSIKASLRSVIEKHGRGSDASYIYVYLRPFPSANAGNSVILWSDPPKIESIFTPFTSSR